MNENILAILTKMMMSDDETKKIVEFSLVGAPKFQLLASLAMDKSVGKARRTRTGGGFMPEMGERPGAGRSKTKAKGAGSEEDGEIKYPDPILEKESMGDDARFAIGLKVAIVSDGVSRPGRPIADQKDKPKATPTRGSGKKKTPKKAPK